ncbi:MAG: DUF2298 domain-containing protein, partial [Dehalococcoidia bacterium]|nr:DUF2298 domain-containing protein [Dehalococcoidia bacterium]
MGALVDAVALPTASWWLAIQLIGVAAAPIALRWFPTLPDRGLAFAKVLGLVVAGYAYWIAGSVGLAPAGRGAVVLAVLALALLGLFLLGGQLRASGDELRGWWRRRWPVVVAGEAIFAVVLFGWATVRAYNPDIAGTEKPMELAFLNASLRATAFPPLDPWLAGHTISYYYFGYVLMAMMAQLTATPGAVAFNLALALVMALTAQAVAGLTAGIVAARWSAITNRVAIAAGALGTFTLLFLGNLVGALDFAISRGWGTTEFWRSIGIDGLTTPYVSPTWLPTEFWWWWKATRVINTFVNGQGVDYTITEFPIFSFVLGDLHPHVMALPFNMLALGVALTAFTAPTVWGLSWLRANIGWGLLTAVVIGALGFLNSWDLPTYAFVVFAAVALRALRDTGKLDRRLLIEIGGFVAIVGGASLVLYAPFYASFSSQASGLRPVVGVGTQP